MRLRKGLKHRTTLVSCAVMALMLAATALSGCTSGKESVPSKESAGSIAKMTELTVLLDWYPNAVHSFLFAAEEQGYFKEAGLKVNLQTPAGTNDALKLVASGKADMALSYQSQVVISRAEDIPVVSIAAIVRHPLNQLLLRESAGVMSPKDLAGKKIGHPSMTLDQAIIGTMVEQDGGNPADIEYVDVGWDLIPAMTTGRVDAIIGGFVNHEKLLLEKEGIQLKTIAPSDYGVPDYYELVLIASEQGLASKREALQKFVEAARRGQQYTVEHSAEALQVLLDKQSADFPLDPDIEKQSLDILLPLMDAGKEAFGSQTEASWQSIVDWLQQHGQLAKQVEAKDMFRNL